MLACRWRHEVRTPLCGIQMTYLPSQFCLLVASALTGPENEDEVDPTLAREAGLLELGTTVRVIRDPYFGLLGEVSALPTEPAVLGSGSRARVLEVRFPGGDTAVVPRANVELIEG